MGAFLPKGIEWVIILLVVLIIFGPKNLPKLGRAISNGLKGLRKGVSKKKSAAPVETEAEATVVEAAEPVAAEPAAAAASAAAEPATAEPAAAQASAEPEAYSAQEQSATKTVKRMVVKKKVEE